MSKPFFLGPPPKYSKLWLLPKQKTAKQIPIQVWAFKTPDGWAGWLESKRGKGNVQHSHWSAETWTEVTEKAAKAAVEKANAQAAAKANAGPTPKRKPGQTVLTAAQAEAVKRGKRPGLAKGKGTAETPPDPPPTGTDGPAKPEAEANVTHEPNEVAQALETAVQTLAQVAQALRKQDREAQGKGKPGLKKARPAPVAPVRKRA